MSLIKLQGNASGTGAFTIAAPNGNTDRTLTLPDATGTVNVSGLANEVPAGSAGAPAIYPTGDSNTGIFFPAADTVAVATGGSEQVRVDSSGNLLVGTTSQYGSQKLSLNGGIAIDGRSAATPGLSEKGDDNTGVFWPAADALGFSTGGTERARINASGAVTINNLAGTGSRAVNASATGVLSAASDSRLKEEVPEASIPSLAEVMLLKPRAYKWLDDIEKRGEDAAVEIGFFADEVKDIIPSAAPMGNDGYYGFFDRSVIAALTMAIQEQQTLIQELTARVATLEAN